MGLSCLCVLWGALCWGVAFPQSVEHACPTGVFPGYAGGGFFSRLADGVGGFPDQLTIRSDQFSMISSELVVFIEEVICLEYVAEFGIDPSDRGGSEFELDDLFSVTVELDNVDATVKGFGGAEPAVDAKLRNEDRLFL